MTTPPSLTSTINTLLSDSSRSLIDIYIEIQELCEQQYGEQTITLIEVGSFFEVYGIDNAGKKIGKPKEVADILNLQLTRKNKTIIENSLQNPLLAGFPTASFDRYVSRLVQENRYTLVVIRQHGTPPNITRFVDGILSPGVNFEYALNHRENCITTIAVDKQGQLYSVGYASIDVTTGKTLIFEAHGTKEDPSFALDELFRVLQNHSSNEFILRLLNTNIDPQEIATYLELNPHSVKCSTATPDVTYQNALFKETFSIESMLTPIEYLDLERQPLAASSLAVLIEYIIEHDPRLIQGLSRPISLDPTNYMYLGNNPLEQLNVISLDPREPSILKHIDYTSTSIGSRLLRERLHTPLTNAKELEERYDLADAVEPLLPKIKRQLNTVYDLERLLRRIELGRLHPFELNFLYDSLKAIQACVQLIDSTHTVIKRLESEAVNIQQCIATLEEMVDFECSTKYNQSSITESFFVRGFDTELDQLVAEKNTLEEKLELIRTKIVTLIHKQTGKTAEEENDYVQIKQLDKEGHYVNITKNRYFLIQDQLKETMISIDGTVYACSDFSYKVQTTNVKVTAAIIDDISHQIVVLQNQIIARVKEVFMQQLQQLSAQFGESIRVSSHCIAQIDVAASTISCAQTHHFTRPHIIAFDNPEQEIDPDAQVLELIQVRHPLVEAREENGVYVPNDVVLGSTEYIQHTDATMHTLSEDDIRGVLLYGINSSGKSSLMKSIGICIVLAQAGYYVPAEQMRFTLFHQLFTRIIAKDDVQKGLSSFGVEMMELKNIFNRCTNRSLILGDEISHGTETLSAIAIVTSTILRLTQLRAFFLFATHLHQLQTLELLRDNTHVVSMHLGVRYDEQEDKIIFDRTLQPGNGSTLYGLEFARSLHMDDQFVRDALHIRKQLANDYSGIELLTKQQRSAYNQNLIITQCAVCKKPVEDTHHIKPQHTADKHGHIKHIPKDHAYNLIPLCKDCHNKAHNGTLKISGFTMTSHGLELQYEEKPENKKNGSTLPSIHEKK